MKTASTQFRNGTLIAAAASPNSQYFVPAVAGGQVLGICCEDIFSTDTDYTSNRRVAVDFPVNDSDEFEAIVYGAVAGPSLENQTFDVYGDPTNDPYTQMINVGTPGTQFVYMRTTQSDSVTQTNNTAIFKFNRTKGVQIT